MFAYNHTIVQLYIIILLLDNYPIDLYIIAYNQFHCLGDTSGLQIDSDVC